MLRTGIKITDGHQLIDVKRKNTYSRQNDNFVPFTANKNCFQHKTGLKITLVVMPVKVTGHSAL